MDDAAFVSNNVPAVLAASHDFPARITVLNTGTTTWSAAAGYALAVLDDPCGMVGAARVPIPGAAVVGPGQSFTFDVMLSAPGALGPCPMQFQMVRDADAVANLFGPVLDLSPIIVAAVNNATFQNDTIPATMAPNQSLGVGVTMRNTGTTTWFAGSAYSLAVTGSPCMIPLTLRIEVRPGDIVSPNTSYQFVTQLTAPAAPGPCAIDYRMIEEFVESFGETAAISVNIANPPNSTTHWEDYE